MNEEPLISRCDVEDTLASMAADLLSEKRYETFLKSLFMQEQGSWHDLVSLLNGLENERQVLSQLIERYQLRYDAMWIAHTGLPSGYCLVVFLELSNMWSTLAYFNRDSFLREEHREDNRIPKQSPVEPLADS